MSPDPNPEVLELLFDPENMTFNKPFTRTSYFSPVFDESCFNLFGTPMRIETKKFDDKDTTIAFSPKYSPRYMNTSPKPAKVTFRKTVKETFTVSTPDRKMETSKLLEEFNEDCDMIVSLQMNLNANKTSKFSSTFTREVHVQKSPKPMSNGIDRNSMTFVDEEFSRKVSFRDVRDTRHPQGMSWNVKLDETGYKYQESSRSVTKLFSQKDGAQNYYEDKPYAKVTKHKVCFDETRNEQYEARNDEFSLPLHGATRCATRPMKIKPASRKKALPAPGIGSVFDPPEFDPDQESILIDSNPVQESSKKSARPVTSQVQGQRKDDVTLPTKMKPAPIKKALSATRTGSVFGPRKFDPDQKSILIDSNPVQESSKKSARPVTALVQRQRKADVTLPTKMKPAPIKKALSATRTGRVFGPPKFESDQDSFLIETNSVQKLSTKPSGLVSSRVQRKRKANVIRPTNMKPAPIKKTRSARITGSVFDPPNFEPSQESFEIENDCVQKLNTKPAGTVSTLVHRLCKDSNMTRPSKIKLAPRKKDLQSPATGVFDPLEFDLDQEPILIGSNPVQESSAKSARPVTALAQCKREAADKLILQKQTGCNGDLNSHVNKVSKPLTNSSENFLNLAKQPKLAVETENVKGLTSDKIKKIIGPKPIRKAKLSFKQKGKNEDKKTNLKCEYCISTFLTGKELKMHNKKVHSKTNLFF